ncbi:microtubule-actin cross-linking factor 1, isoforms 6/7-like [Bombina bombina]|uniref:microtubule-actin cross-linking factor 1, isoforms 6/7-like n=1 Tax=Bombina bombina TaxID=8345 RepID=UPI00235A7A1A|nr:microtubule-actin cross-linking factor 1, isoforms 6/7-like [Bombina bombina]
MGNLVSRPSCLGEKSRKSEKLLKECCLKKETVVDITSLRNNAEICTSSGEKKQNELVIEKELNVTPTSCKSSRNEPLPKQNNTEAKIQNGAVRTQSPKSTPDHVANVWTPQRGTLQRASGSSWSWKPYATKEVTEVTEVTETVVTEIVEVTQYPSGDKSGEPIVTRTVKVLTGCAGEMSEVQSSREVQTESQYRMGQWDSFSHTIAQRALTLPEDWQSSEPQESLETILTWITDMEELTEVQKSPSSEAKVVKAQLQEQKLLQRLLEERRPKIERVLHDKKSPSQPLPIEGVEAKQLVNPLSHLQERFDTLIQKAEARHRHLEQIVPAAQRFQEALDAFQDWVNATERQLAELWRAKGSMSQIENVHQQVQLLCQEIQSKPGDLEDVLERGQMLLEMVAGEEAQLSQEKMDALRVRYLIISQSTGDILLRLEQTLEATSRLDPSQEDVSLWLGRMEKLVSSCSSEREELTLTDTEKV